MTQQRRPLLIIDGDSFAHRSYHALPKSIRRQGDKGAGAILGFANFLLRLYETEKPRAVLDRLHEALGIGIEVWTAESDPMDIDSVHFERLLKPARQLGVIVALSVSG